MTSSQTASSPRPLVVAVGGGKGGVGKSVIALNLAISFAKLGTSTTVIDADLGSANLHTMLGIDRPGLTVQALLDGRVKELSEVTVPTSVPELLLVPGTVAVPGAANLHHGRKQKLIRQIERLPCEIAVVDCGAGIHYNTVDLFMAADLKILVASPQLVSLQNAYGFLKASVYRMLRQHAQELRKAELVEHATDNSEVETVIKLLASVREHDVALAESLTELLFRSSFVLMGNQLSDPRELNALQALSRMIGDFLSLKVPVLGALLRRDRIHAGVSRRRPFALDGGEPEARLLLQIADRILTAGQRASSTRRAAEQTSEFPLEGASRPPVRESGIEYRGGAAPVPNLAPARVRSR